MNDRTFAIYAAVLPAAVENAQRVASEHVANALVAAEQAGYERGRAELRASTDGEQGLYALLKRAERVLADAEASAVGFDAQCDELNVASRRRGKRCDHIKIPSDSASFSDVAEWLEVHGSSLLVDPDSIEIDSDEIRNAASTLRGECQVLRELLEEALGRLAPQFPETRQPGETSAQRDARVGVITQSQADEVDGVRRAWGTDR